MTRSKDTAHADRISSPEQAVLCALVIDDHEPTAQSISDFLRTHGYESVFALNGQTGLTLVWQRRPKIVFCDLAMPEVDGYQVAALIRSDQSYQPLLVAFGERAGEALEQRARGAGFDQYLAKPVDPFQLLPLVEAACGESAEPR